MEKFKALVLGFFVSSCGSFPYGGVIKESKRYLNESKKSIFKVLETPDGNIHYLSLESRSSKKPLLVLIHGSPGDYGSFAHFYKDENLSRNFNIITFDRPGYGKHYNGNPVGSLSEQIKIPLSLIKSHKNSEAVIVVGHSYGGPVAAKLAALAPKEVDGLIIVAGSLDPELEETKWYQLIAEKRFFRWMIPENLDVCNREILELQRELPVLEKELKNIKVPVSIIHGDNDKLVPVENVTYMEKHMNKMITEKVIIQNGKHFVPWAFPDVIKESAFKQLKLITEKK